MQPGTVAGPCHATTASPLRKRIRGIEVKQTQPQPGALALRVNDKGEPEFEVEISSGSWRSCRTITVTDATIDIGDIIRAIAGRKTEVTEIEKRFGVLNWREDERISAVGRWATKFSTGYASSVEITLPLSNGFQIQRGKIADEQDDLPF